jgi:phosphinothricin acetyltransferase
MKDYFIDNMLEHDWEQVCDIYWQGLLTRQSTFETKVPTWQEWNASHLQTCRLVARAGENIKGWAALSAVSQRCVYAGVAETSVYIGEHFRGEGVGSALLEALIQASEANGIWTLQAGMFPENSASIRLHKKFGFREIGRRVRIGKLENRWRDTLLLERRSNTVGTD